MVDYSVQILESALGLIESKGWTRGVMARDRWGYDVEEWGDAATRFCAEGALSRAANDISEAQGARWMEESLENAKRSLIAAIIDERDVDAAYGVGEAIAEWNDDPRRNKEQVAAMFRKARDIALAAL